jgi:CubicO group peptidase (beta-lactamase class C family)
LGHPTWSTNPGRLCCSQENQEVERCAAQQISGCHPSIDYTEQNSAGLGWVWWKNGGKNYVSQTGGTGGYSSCAVFEHSTRTGVVMLTNVSAFLASKGESITQMGIELHRSLFHAMSKGT